MQVDRWVLLVWRVGYLVHKHTVNFAAMLYGNAVLQLMSTCVQKSCLTGVHDQEGSHEHAERHSKQQMNTQQHLGGRAGQSKWC